MSMERYNEYKDSGVQWLGEIPSHWGILPGRVIFDENKKKNDGSDRSVLSLSYGKIVVKNDINEGLVPAEYSNYQIIEPGYIIVRCTDLQNDKVSLRTAISLSSGIITSAYLGLVTKNDQNSFFINYLLRAWDNCKELYRYGSGLRQSLSWVDFKYLLLPIPPKEEQDAMVAYLDEATSKIDAAIAQQQKMIDLLNERKQIIINNAVTKGLNPNVKMKDSGVDWIGEIPEGWEVMKMKHFVEITDGTHDTPRYVDPSNNTYPLVTSRCIVNGNIDLSLANHIAEQDYKEIAVRSYVCKYDVIMPMIGTVGNPAIIDFDDSIAIKNVALFRTHGDKYKSKYLKFLLNSFIVKEQFAMYNKGGVQNFVSQDILKNLTILVPKNIREIVCFIDNEILKIESPMSAINHQIALLQERKQIIINDVVTGKVKVS